MRLAASYQRSAVSHQLWKNRSLFAFNFTHQGLIRPSGFVQAASAVAFRLRRDFGGPSSPRWRSTQAPIIGRHMLASPLSFEQRRTSREHPKHSHDEQKRPVAGTQHRFPHFA
jgi:hypothetical protein